MRNLWSQGKGNDNMSDFKLIKKDTHWIVIDDIERNHEKIFDFKHCPNEWFVEAHKQYIEDMLTMKKVKPSTLNRYHYNHQHFYEFLKNHQIELIDFSGLSYDITQMYLFYLKQSELAKATQTLSMTALKSLIGHGRELNYPGFPTEEVFDGKEYKSLKPNEEYITEYIPDDVMIQIESGLLKEKDILLQALLIIVIDTGLRIDEALILEEDCIILDFLNKPILEMYSPKNNRERSIPVSNRVMYAIEELESDTREIRKEMNTKKLFVYKKRDFRYLNQSASRKKLNRFIDRNAIKTKDNSLYRFNFHSFRHKLGTDMLNNGITIFEVQNYLGHDSLRSTEHYAKVQDPTVVKEYNEIGFVGVITDDFKNAKQSNQNDIDESTLEKAALPDGACGLPINDEGVLCAKYNMCILCPKFVTTPEFLPIHKNHLQRLRKDRLQYMSEEHVGTMHHLMKMEKALETIIGELEELSDGE